MSEDQEEVTMDSSVSEEKGEEPEGKELEEEVTDGGSNQKGSKMFAGDIIIEGKRTKKSVERLDFQAPKQKEKLRVGDGGGAKLGDIPRTNHQITKMKPAELKPLHALLFDRPGKMSSIKKNLRLFNGFTFSNDSETFIKKRDKLIKSSYFTNSKLKVMCSVLDLEKKGTHSDLVERILNFLIAPRSSGKRLPVKKKRKSKKKLSVDGVDQKKKKKKKKVGAKNSSSAPRSPKKAKAGSKSKAIVMDSSSDEVEEEEEEEEEKPSVRKGKESEEEESKESEEEESEEEFQNRKTSKRTPAKKNEVTSSRKRNRKQSEDTPTDTDGELKPQKKKKMSTSSGTSPSRGTGKGVAETKKADSSSSRKNLQNGASSDEDEPLINMVKKSPSDEELKETVKVLLDRADLQEVTMKQICQRVYSRYPDHELSNRKDFIKQTVRNLIT